MTSAYVQQLKAETAQRAAEQVETAAEADREVATRAARDRMTPLTVRLSALLRDVPAELQREGLQLAALQARLRGRRHGSAHGGDVAASLRALGWRQVRRWVAGQSHSRRWYPPAA